MIKGTHGLQQRGLALFTAGLALCSPISWLFQDWYNGDLEGPSIGFKVAFAISHLICGITAIIMSIKTHDKIDKKEHRL
jgi:hypothetical protein